MDLSVERTDAPEDKLRARVREVLGPPDRERAGRTLELRMRWFVVLQAITLAVLLSCPVRSLEVLTAVLFGLYRARTLWTIVHDRVHQPPLPLTPARLLYDLCTGFVVQIWQKEHLAHHAHTNTPRDPDLRLFLGRTLGAPGAGSTRALRWLLTVAQMPAIFGLLFLRSLTLHPARKVVVLLAGLIAFPLVLRLVLEPQDALLNSAAIIGLGSAYVLVTFAPTHAAHEGNFALRGERMQDAVIATNDVWPTNRAWCWFTGGINVHTAHHLFPQVPSEELHRLVPLVETYAAERRLVYHRWSLWALWRAHLAFLWRT